MIKKLGSNVYQLVYPSPIKVIPPVNGYVILGDKPLLIDGGTSDDATWSAFLADLDELKLKIQDFGAFLVTHNHIDHIGIASRIAATDKKIKVHVHEEEWWMVNATDEEREKIRATLAQIIGYWGVPPEIVLAMKEKLLKALRLGGGIPRDQVLPYDKGQMKICGVCLDPIHCPGHTEGLTCFWWNDEKTLFSNDHVLETITPNPTLYLKPRHGKRCGLGDYVKSLSNIEHLPVKTVLPGHGSAFSDLGERISKIRGYTGQRRNRILLGIQDHMSGDPVSIIELTMQLWSNLDPVQTFLAAREVHGYMEMLTEEGLITSETRDGVGRFKLNAEGERMIRDQKLDTESARAQAASATE